MTSYIINQTAAILHINGKRFRVEKTDPRYAKVVKALELPASKKDAALLEILKPVAVAVASIGGKNGFEVVGDSVTYKGKPVPETLVKKIKSIIKEGLSLESFQKFWENLEQNPSATSVSELIEFLEYKELPITEDGHFLAYKGIGTDDYSVHGNTKTTVTKGKVDSAGRIYNGVGETITVTRREVDDNRNNHCSFGLHVGSLDYASSFAPKLVVVKVNPKDVVSVPSDYNCQKCRVSEYTVVQEFVQEIKAPVVDEDGGDTVVTDSVKERKNFAVRVAAYINKKRDQGHSEVTLRQIRGIFSPDSPSKIEILDALQELNITWETDEDGSVYVEL